MKNCALFILSLLLFVTPAFAAKKEAALIAKIEGYFRELKTLKADFVQTSPDGTELSGKFYLSRPGRMRFDYDLPLEDFIIADGIFVYYYDGELKQQSNAPINQTLGYYILRKDVSLGGELNVDELRTDRKLLEVTLSQKADPGAGALTLYFEKEPLALKKWSVVDAQGLVTRIALSNQMRDTKLDSALFHYRDPQDMRFNR